MAIQDSLVNQAFQRGDYPAVLKLSIDTPKAQWRIQDLGAILGALAFLGRMDEAEALYQSHRRSMPVRQRIQCRFFLGLGLTRKSDYRGARKHLIRNLRGLGPKSSSESVFYAYQGLAFYRYYCGRLRSARRAAEKSFKAAIAANSLYGRVLSSDLLGHLQIQTGDIEAGLQRLRDAQELASHLGNPAFVESMGIEMLNYESRYGLDIKNAVRKLQKKISQVSVQNNYSRANLLLELSRQLLIRARIEEAVTLLDQASRIIYMNQNRRQETSLNLSYAYAAYLSGETSRGLSLVQSAKRSLDPVVDNSSRLSILGLELALIRRIGNTDREKEILKTLIADSRRYGGSLNQRILRRSHGAVTPLDLREAEDRIGSIRDLILTDPANAIRKIVQTGLLIFLYDLLPIRAESQLICLDILPDSLTLFDRGYVEHTAGMTPLLRALLKSLFEGKGSKKELVETIWGYSYHPLRHDSVVYSAMTNLRRLLGQRGHWIETTEQGYRISNGIQLVDHSAMQIQREVITAQTTHAVSQDPEQSIPAPAQAPTTLPSSPIHDLNSRQIRALEQIQADEFIHVKSYQKKFKVSEITALRDLAGLTRLGLMVRTGRARATRYSLPSAVQNRTKREN